MTLDELESLVAKVELRNFPFQVRIATRWFYVGQRKTLVIAIQAKIKDRDTGLPSYVDFEQSYSEAQIDPWDEDAAMELALYRPLRDMAIHEVAEALHFKGVRIYDPHRDEKT
jgi:hypothetical protein